MGYRKIQNLYKDIRILSFKECYALEKIHGTSAHIALKDGELRFFSGGATHESFVALFDEEKLKTEMIALGHPSVCIYGEAYGGKQQKMSHTYGKDLRFIGFEVKIGDEWQDVPTAEYITRKIGLEFVAYNKGEATVEWLNEQRDLPSSEGIIRVGEEKMREGIVIRPIEEVRDHRGNRIITKHKRDEFRETKTKREVDPEKMKKIGEANAVAEEWVTPMRLDHVLDKLPEKGEMKHVGSVIKAMQADVKAESEGEVIWSKAVEKAIGNKTVALYKKHISKI